MSTTDTFYRHSEDSESARGKGVKFCRTRRITGYLTGDLTTWNDAKKKEEADRVSHS